MRRTKASLWALAATAATVATLFLLPYTPKAAVRTATVERGDLVMTVRMQGALAYGDQRPCVALVPGRVSAVCVGKGDAVRAGDLLFRLDTGAEERALAALSAARYSQRVQPALAPYAQALEAASAQSLMEARVREEELRARIEMKCVRAEADGVVGGVYVREGDYAAEAAALGLVHDGSLRAFATCRAADVSGASVGTPARLYGASGEALGLATVESMAAPARDGASGQLVQTLTFAPKDGAALSGMRAGDALTVELLTEAMRDVPLAPVAAVDAGDLVWVVENGKAAPVQIGTDRRNDDAVRVPEALLGRAVILDPDESALYAGCPVKEAKRR